MRPVVGRVPGILADDIEEEELAEFDAKEFDFAGGCGGSEPRKSSNSDTVDTAELPFKGEGRVCDGAGVKSLNDSSPGCVVCAAGEERKSAKSSSSSMLTGCETGGVGWALRRGVCEREVGGGGSGAISALVPDRRSTLPDPRRPVGGGERGVMEPGLGRRGGAVDDGLDEDDMIGTKARLLGGGKGLFMGAEG